MIEQDIAFSALSALTIVAAIFSLESKNVVYGAIGLAFTFLGIGGLFIVLGAAFVALFQIIVNIGAVAVLILFTVMLVGEGKIFRDSWPLGGKIAGGIAALVLAVALALSFASSTSAGSGPSSTVPNSFDIGTLMTSQFALTLEVLALVFGSSLLGALTLAKLDKDGKKSA
jgi:NADH-quinone oxidoreductase subunit J